MKSRNIRYAKNKYKNISCKCSQGHIHDSRGEAGYCSELRILQKAKEIKSYEIQKKYSLDINGKHITNHIVDFVVTYPDKHIEVHEFKGFATALWKLKQKMFEAIYPDIPYIVVAASSSWTSGHKNLETKALVKNKSRMVEG